MINNSFFFFILCEDLMGDCILIFYVLMLYLNIEINVHSEVTMIISKIDLWSVWRASDGPRDRLRSRPFNINMRMFLLHSKSHFLQGVSKVFHVAILTCKLQERVIYSSFF